MLGNYNEVYTPAQLQSFHEEALAKILGGAQAAAGFRQRMLRSGREF